MNYLLCFFKGLRLDRKIIIPAHDVEFYAADSSVIALLKETVELSLSKQKFILNKNIAANNSTRLPNSNVERSGGMILM